MCTQNTEVLPQHTLRALRHPPAVSRAQVQQFAKNAQGVTVSPKEAVAEANAVFKAAPISASLSGLWPRIVGVLLKRIPKVRSRILQRGCAGRLALFVPCTDV